MARPSASPITLVLSGLTKTYPGAVALNDVCLSVRGGEVVGLIGENGAGKSTLLKILAGSEEPTRGAITIDGTAHSALTPSMSIARGIALVHQELNPFPNLDVAGNILLGREIRRGPFGALDRAAMADAVRPVLATVGARFGPSDPVAGLSLAELQLLEVCRGLSRNARLLILDEPTSSLTLAEADLLLATIRDLRDRGVAVLFVSHRLSEVSACADRVVVLRDGRNAGELDGPQISHDAMTRLMIGRDLMRDTARASVPGKVRLDISDLATTAHPNAAASLSVRAGEVLGLGGLVGAGRSELARAVFGIDRAVRGQVSVDGVALPPSDITAAMRAGLFLVPEDRKTDGLFLDFPITTNVALPSLPRLARHGLVNRMRERDLAETARSDLGIKAASVDQATAELSGGNQQKVVLARWLALRPRVLILDEPTRGIDVGAKAEVYAIMRRLAAEGVAILMISSDMEELMSVATRVAVMRRGDVTATLEGADITELNIMRNAVD